MANFSFQSTDPCLLPILQKEFTCTSFVATETYMHNEASALGFDISIGTETDTEVRCRCT